MRPIRRPILAFLALLTILAAPAAAQDEPLDGFGAFVERARSDWGVPGVAVSVVKDGEVVFLDGFGVREHDRPGAVDADTIFQLGSLSKSFTAAALGVLVDAGTLDWDDPVADHLPGFVLHDAYAGRYATVRDLLAHRTGLPAFGGDLLGSLGYDRREVLRRVRHLQPDGSFRERAGYSNVGFAIAGMLAGEANGTTWEDLVAARLLAPLEMDRTGLSWRDRSRHENVAANHRSGPDGVEAVPWQRHDVLGPAGSVTSTARDMANYVRMLLAAGRFEDRAVLSPDALEEMFRPAMVERPSFSEAPPIDEDSGFAYGLGWNVYHYAGHRIVEKGGALGGVRTVTVLVPDEGLGVTVLANLNLTFLPEVVRAHVLEAYLGASGEDLEAEMRERSDTLLAATFAPDAPIEDPAPPSLPFEAYAGVYENDLYGRFAVRPEDGALRLRAGPACYEGPLTHAGHDAFTWVLPEVNVLPEPVRFAVDATGAPVRLETESYGDFDRVEARPGDCG